MDADRLAVAVPTKDRRETVVSALAPIVAQLGSKDDLVVVDNGSTDGTLDAVAAWLRDRFPAGRGRRAIEWRRLGGEKRSVARDDCSNRLFPGRRCSAGPGLAGAAAESVDGLQ